jgi:hypothetical protein
MLLHICFSTPYINCLQVAEFGRFIKFLTKDGIQMFVVNFAGTVKGD